MNSEDLQDKMDEYKEICIGQLKYYKLPDKWKREVIQLLNKWMETEPKYIQRASEKTKNKIISSILLYLCRTNSFPAPSNLERHIIKVKRKRRNEKSISSQYMKFLKAINSSGVISKPANYINKFLKKQSYSDEIKNAIEKKAGVVYDNIPLLYKHRNPRVIAAAILYEITKNMTPQFLYRFTQKQLANEFQITSVSLRNMAKQVRDNKR